MKDVKLISAGKILENNRTLGECQSPLCDIPGGVTTMHVIVQPSSLDKGTDNLCNFPKTIAKRVSCYISFFPGCFLEPQPLEFIFSPFF